MISGVRIMADIGSDHGYLPVRLLYENKIERAIITDIGELPLKTAKSNACSGLCEHLCSFRLGDGLKPLKPREAECIVIAGMGGNLISNILKDGEDVAKSAEFLILQAMQHTTNLREFLNNNSYKIMEERVVYDSGKYYEIIKVVSGEQRKFTKLELEIGYAMVKDDVYYDFLNKKSEQFKKIINSRQKSKTMIEVDEYKKVLLGIESEVLEKEDAGSCGFR